MKRTLLGFSLLCAGSALFLASCSSKNKTFGVSEKTGWNYNDARLGGFEVVNYAGQQTGPGLVPIEGGSYVMGQTEDNVTFQRNNSPRRVTVPSFYMDETEVANVHYREYLYWLGRAYGSDYPELVAQESPDSTVWRKALSYNEPLVNYYFRHAAYDYYPVVGVNWNQARKYAMWRSDRVNEMLLIKARRLNKNVNQVNEDIYNTEAYVTDQYLGSAGKGRRRDLDPSGADRRNDDYSDGILLPNYRLPTEAEWEYAALAPGSRNPKPATSRRRGEEALTDRNAYPWGDPRSARAQAHTETQGQFLANYKRGRGDFMGTPYGLNDNAAPTARIDWYPPNAYGLYNMAGNVNEWVLDVYRPTAHQEVDGFNPYFGNEYTKNVYEEDFTLTEKDEQGKLIKAPIDTTDWQPRYNSGYTSADLRDYRDGSGDTLGYNGFYYDYGKTTLINKESRVFKGGSWYDGKYWLNPGTRRYMNQNLGSMTVGFRCVMDRLGDQNFGETKNTAKFGKQRRNKKI